MEGISGQVIKLSATTIGSEANLGWGGMPSTRPESDFTLDVPRAEQLRLKMKKEKQFRSRCRWFFYFLSIVFFLLSVMVVSLILTRGKRMFGSMI
uniref:Uncharacterized protein n=2 Tax=Pyretophorus TaxID=44537 RepID=A0A182I6G1_ANOAR